MKLLRFSFFLALALGAAGAPAKKILFGGIDWALGRVDADVTPNLAKVAPRAAELPPGTGPVAGWPKNSPDKK